MSTETPRYDVAIIGGGIVGLATARTLLHRFPALRLLLLEKESRVATHQTGHNSGVIHSGVYYRPGSLKATLCVTGGRRLEQFCQSRGIPVHRCGKVIVAVEPQELPRLEMVYERGLANGVPGLSRIGPERLCELEPQVQGLQALHLPGVAIVDYVTVANAFRDDVAASGGAVRISTRVTRLDPEDGGWRVGTTQGAYRARFLINCGGLHADRLGGLAGERSSVRIVPFRGEYYTLPDSRASLVRGLVYPVPDPALPFLGIHLTKLLSGGVHVGPNAVLALKREGYRRADCSMRDCVEMAFSPGFWRMAGRYWRAGLTEAMRSWSRQRFLRAAQRLVPALCASDLLPCPAGVRAQAVERDGRLLDDFALYASPRALHVYNAPSPAATASLSIGEAIVERVADVLETLQPVTVPVP